MIKSKKTLQELTIMDGFLFGAVMQDPEICRGLLEKILEIPISRVHVILEKSLIYHPEYKGIRLDVFADDEAGTRYDVEVQIQSTPVARRSRYYHSQMDMEMLLSGISYKNLPDSYVIFICGFDPFKEKKYRYTFKNICEESRDLTLKDGSHTIILYNGGENPEDIHEDLVRFMEFTRKDLVESEISSEDDYIKALQESIRQIKADREMGERYMTLQEMLLEEREAGLEEGLQKGLEQGLEQGRFTILVQLVNNNILTVEQASLMLGISNEEFQVKMEESDTV